MQDILKQSIYPFSSLKLFLRRERYYVECYSKRVMVHSQSFATLPEAENYYQNLQFRIAVKIHETVDQLFMEEAKGGH